MLTNKERNERVHVLETMISLYCKKKHKTIHVCEECEDLRRYAISRLDECPLLDDRIFCSSCEVHCYDKVHRELIKKVMVFSGKRMILYHPIMALRHVAHSIKTKIAKRNKNVSS